MSEFREFHHPSMAGFAGVPCLSHAVLGLSALQLGQGKINSDVVLSWLVQRAVNDTCDMKHDACSL